MDYGIITFSLPRTFRACAPSTYNTPAFLRTCFHSICRFIPNDSITGPIRSFFDSILKQRYDKRLFDAQFNFLSGGNPATLSFSRIEELFGSGKLILAPMERFDDTCLLLE
jgi:hypothetical protein